MEGETHAARCLFIGYDGVVEHIESFQISRIEATTIYDVKVFLLEAAVYEAQTFIETILLSFNVPYTRSWPHTVWL